jgi:hypothetical protein
MPSATDCSSSRSSRDILYGIAWSTYKERHDAVKSMFLNPTMVVACLALALSLGGTAYAVTRLPANSVGSRQVIDYTLQRRDLHAGVLAITGKPLVKVATAFPAPNAAGETDAFIPCPEGSYATGGGFLADFSADRDLVILGSAPTTLDFNAPDNSHPDGWMVRLINHGATQRPVKYYVVCVRG